MLLSLSITASLRKSCSSATRIWRREGRLHRSQNATICFTVSESGSVTGLGRSIPTCRGLGSRRHPGVILVVEGKTEEVFVSLVRDHIPIPDQAEVIQSVVLRGIRRDLTKLAAFASAPLLGEKMPPHSQGEAWVTLKPPTRLMVVVDPDAPYDSPENVEAQRRLIVEEIIAVVRAQGVEPNPDDVDSLVSVKTWSESCLEFAHFTDDELADALLHVHPHCGGWDKSSPGRRASCAARPRM